MHEHKCTIYGDDEPGQQELCVHGKLPAPMMTVFNRAAVWPDPILLNSTGA